jgi:hypothetical protein
MECWTTLRGSGSKVWMSLRTSGNSLGVTPTRAVSDSPRFSWPQAASALHGDLGYRDHAVPLPLDAL